MTCAGPYGRRRTYPRPVRETSITTPDGRSLRVIEAGRLDGLPVLYHHGTPGNRALLPGWIEDAEAQGLRLIAYDRPGYGDSDRHEGRRVAGAAADVAAIADALGIERLASWGVSGGGPHVLATAALLGERVVAAASLASVAPYGADGLDWMAGMGEDNVREFGAALDGAEALAPLLEGMRDEMVGATADQVGDAMRSLLSPPDAAVLTGEVAEFFVRSFSGAVGGRVDGWLDDDLAFTEPWGFELADIAVPMVLWQGGQDLFVPPAHGEWLAARIPRVEAHLSEADGHLTLSTARIPEVHAWLKARF